MKYLKEAGEIWKELVPKSGQSDTVQGELLRAIEKLRDESMRNGNGNWDERFDILCDYLRKYLIEHKGLNFFARRKVSRLIDLICISDEPCLDEAVYDELTDYFILWTRNQNELIKHHFNDQLKR